MFALLAFGLGLFVFIPACGDTISLVTGVNRLLFTFCCFLICFCFYKLTLKFPVFIHNPPLLQSRRHVSRHPCGHLTESVQPSDDNEVARPVKPLEQGKIKKIYVTIR